MIAFPNVFDHYFPVRPFVNKSIELVTLPIKWVM